MLEKLERSKTTAVMTFHEILTFSGGCFGYLNMKFAGGSTLHPRIHEPGESFNKKFVEIPENHPLHPSNTSHDFGKCEIRPRKTNEWLAGSNSPPFDKEEMYTSDENLMVVENEFQLNHFMRIFPGGCISKKIFRAFSTGLSEGLEKMTFFGSTEFWNKNCFVPCCFKLRACHSRREPRQRWTR